MLQKPEFLQSTSKTRTWPQPVITCHCNRCQRPQEFRVFTSTRIARLRKDFQYSPSQHAEQERRPSGPQSWTTSIFRTKERENSLQRRGPTTLGPMPQRRILTTDCSHELPPWSSRMSPPHRPRRCRRPSLLSMLLSSDSTRC